MIWDVLMIIIAFISVALSIMAIRINKKHNKQKDDRIEYIQDHADIFKVNNRGVSMDKRHIHSLSLEDLGLEGKGQ